MHSRGVAILRSAAICLALGALANVLVAWCCAWPFDPTHARVTLLDQADPVAVSPAHLQRVREHPLAQQFSDDQIMIGRETRPGAERRLTFVTAYWRIVATSVTVDIALANTRNIIVTSVSAGWPARALAGERWSDSHIALGTSAQPIRPQRLLPLRPLWPGFAINTLVYGAVAWLLILAPGVLRRWSRRTRGQCERCGYPCGDSSVCSECGAPLPELPPSLIEIA